MGAEEYLARMRIDKYISNNTSLSRKQTKQALKAGDVLVNDVMVTDPKYVVQESDRVRLSGMVIVPSGPRYFMLNKPPGYVCANRDSQHPTVMSLLLEDEPENMHVAGRLDVDTTGLVLITDDGQWSHRITAPKHKLNKHYRVWLDQPMDESVETVFREGILLKNELKRTRPAELIRRSETEADLTIREGKYHQVKRMFAAVGNHVQQLHRYRIGDIVLDPTLQPGDYRPLNATEINSVGDQ